MAQALLSGVYANTGQRTEAPALSRRAFELRDRVSERERFFDFVALLHRRRAGLGQGARTGPRLDDDVSARSVRVQQPGHRLRRVRSARAGRRGVPRSDPSRRQVRAAAWKPGRVVDRARPVRRGESAACARRAIGGWTSSASGGWPICSPFSTAIPAAMARELDRVRGTPNAMWAAMFQGRTSAFSGRFQAAHEQFQQSVQAAVRDNFRELGAQWTMEDAESHAIAGQCAEARREVRAGLELSRDNFTLERASRTLGVVRRRRRRRACRANWPIDFPTRR